MKFLEELIVSMSDQSYDLSDHRYRQLDPHILPGRLTRPAEAEMRRHVQSPKRMRTHKTHSRFRGLIRALYRVFGGQKRRCACTALLRPRENLPCEARKGHR